MTVVMRERDGRASKVGAREARALSQKGRPAIGVGERADPGAAGVAGRKSDAGGYPGDTRRHLGWR
jgi:hypothetical protein